MTPRDVHPDVAAARAVNDATDYFRKHPLLSVFTNDDGIGFLRSSKEAYCDAAVHWKKPDGPRNFPENKPSSQYGPTFRFVDVYNQLVSAGAHPWSALQLSVAVARESAYCGLAQYPGGSAKGLYQGVSDAYQAVVSRSLIDHAPAAERVVTVSRLRKKTSLKTAYQLHFLPGVITAKRNFNPLLLRGYAWSDGRTWSSQYLFADADNVELTWNDSLLAAVSCWYSYRAKLVDRESDPLTLVVVLPLTLAILPMIRGKKTVTHGSIVRMPAPRAVVKFTSSSQGQATLAMISKGLNQALTGTERVTDLGPNLIALAAEEGARGRKPSATTVASKPVQTRSAGSQTSISRAAAGDFSVTTTYE